MTINKRYQEEKLVVIPKTFEAPAAE